MGHCCVCARSSRPAIGKIMMGIGTSTPNDGQTISNNDKWLAGWHNRCLLGTQFKLGRLMSALRPVLMTPASCGWGQMDAWSGAQMQSLGTCDVSRDHNHTYALRMIEIIFIVFLRFMQDMQVQASVKSLARCEDCIAPNSVLAKNDSGNDSLLLHFCLTIKNLFTSKLPVFYVTC